MMQESSSAPSVVTVSSRSSALASSRRHHPLRHVSSANRVEVRDLLSQRRELVDLIAATRHENGVLRTQAERSAAALDAGDDASDVSHALREHADNVRRLHEDFRTNKIRERSAERKLKKKEAALDKVKQEVTKNKELLDSDAVLPQEDELCTKLARVADSLTAKDNLIQDLRDQVRRITLSHAAAFEKERHRQSVKKREVQRLLDRTDHLKRQIKTVDKELAKGSIYTQTAMRLGHGNGVETLIPVLSAAEHGCALTLQQRIKQFDAVRRQHWQEQVEKESRRKRGAEERKRRRQEADERRWKLEEERRVAEQTEREREQERMRREAEKMEEMEREMTRRTKEQQRHLAEAVEQRERKERDEAERLAREEDERQKKRYREAVRHETDALLKGQNLWYYEGGKTEWRSVTDGDRSSQKAAALSRVPALNTTDQQDEGTDAQRDDGRCSPTARKSPPRGGVKPRNASKPGRRAKRRQKLAAKKCTSESEVTAAVSETPPDHRVVHMKS